MVKSEKPNEIYKRALKYILMFVIVVGSLKFIPQISVNNYDIIKISIIIIIAFSILDMYYPTISTELLQ